MDRIMALRLQNETLENYQEQLQQHLPTRRRRKRHSYYDKDNDDNDNYDNDNDDNDDDEQSREIEMYHQKLQAQQLLNHKPAYLFPTINEDYVQQLYDRLGDQYPTTAWKMEDFVRSVNTNPMVHEFYRQEICITPKHESQRALHYAELQSYMRKTRRQPTMNYYPIITAAREKFLWIWRSHCAMILHGMNVILNLILNLILNFILNFILNK